MDMHFCSIFKTHAHCSLDLLIDNHIQQPANNFPI